MTRTRVRWGRLTVVGCVAVLASAAAGKAAVAPPPEPSTRPISSKVYVVRPGDTLWAIAARIAGPGADPRPVADALEEANGGTATIVPGQAIQLP